MESMHKRNLIFVAYCPIKNPFPEESFPSSAEWQLKQSHDYFILSLR